MFDILRYELYKMQRLKKVYFCAFAINFLPIMILFVLTVLFFKGIIYRDFGMMQQMFVKEFGSGIMGVLVVLLSFFSWSSWFFQTIIAGELISKEFENKSIKLMLLMPFLVLSVLPFAVAALSGWNSPFLAALSLVNVVGSYVDLYNAGYVFWKVPAGAFVRVADDGVWVRRG